MDISGKFHALVALLPGEDPHVFPDQNIGWSPEIVYTIWRGGKSLVPARNRTLNP
jgi:hypothetical protein